MEPLNLVDLTPLMARTSGQAKIKNELIDGRIALEHRILTPTTFTRPAQTIRLLAPPQVA